MSLRQPLTSTAVCITGMHRSGTSMVAGLLREAGLYLGETDDLIPPSKDNTDGFWELTKFVEISDQVLERLGGWWDCVPPLSPLGTPEMFDDLRTSAKAAAEASLAGQPLIGWKDPRASLLLPFWRTVLPISKVVICLRNPLETARSLQKRNGWSLAFGLKLWWVYTQQLIADTTRGERLITHFDAYFHDPRSEVRRLLESVGLPASDAALDRACGRVIPGSRHNRMHAQDLVNARATPEIVELYQRLCVEAGWVCDVPPPPPPGAELPRPGADTFIDDRPVTMVGVPAFDRLQVLTAEVQALRSRVTSREQTVRDLQATLAHEPVAAESSELQRALAAEAVLRQQAAAGARERENLKTLLMAAEKRVEERDRKLETAAHRDNELRQLLLDAHDQLLRRDEEISGMIARLGGGETGNAPAGAAAATPARPAAYSELVERIRATACSVIPGGAIACVISKGDEALVRLTGRSGWHFPRDETGGYTGYSPKDSADAIARLNAAMMQGARYLIVPSTGRWWLDHYADLHRHLKQIGQVAVDNADCVIFDLSPAKAGRSRSRKPAVNGHKA